VAVRKKPASTRALALGGYRKGWLGVVLVDGRFVGARLFGGLADALKAKQASAVVAVDIPIGPTDHGRNAESGAEGVRWPP
jgi:predicted RNase H-like nuclease